jgi:hypothetical protein
MNPKACFGVHARDPVCARSKMLVGFFFDELMKNNAETPAEVR